MTAYTFFLAFTVLVGVVGGFCAVLAWQRLIDRTAVSVGVAA